MSAITAARTALTSPELWLTEFLCVLHVGEVFADFWAASPLPPTLQVQPCSPAACVLPLSGGKGGPGTLFKDKQEIPRSAKVIINLLPWILNLLTQILRTLRSPSPAPLTIIISPSKY